MHLKQLKLSGFKSFVDPTVVPFTSQLIAVVGPNGCGKSNIIDAVRWVMGESSAKNLRGESMTDVIFNGSSNRKSVGQASVELVFDNTMGRLTGQYASYQEIAVKRVVTRDGDSFYFLNGSRCRRRDITDIFLGTGAGARSYSIIGQDTISRLIEARPEDLRAFLEEAAGVSKYKERRRETLQRIDHTRENLARVADVRDELGKQLQRLERQAQSARRYTSLKDEERLCKAEILALKWRALTTEQRDVASELRQQSLQGDVHQTKIFALVKERAELQENAHVTQDHFQHTQEKFYQLNTEIARLEEMIQQQQREQQRLLMDKQEIEADLQCSMVQLQDDQQTLHISEQELVASELSVQSLQIQLQEYQRQLDDKELQKSSWDKSWELAQAALSQARRDAEREQIQLQYLEQQHQQLHVQLEKNQSEQGLLIVEPLEKELFTLIAQKADLTSQADLDAENHRLKVNEGNSLRQQLTALEQQRHEVEDRVQGLVVEQAALSATLNAVLRKEQKGTSHLSQWNDYPRLAEVLTVSDKWLRACELVLGEGLQAIFIDSMNDVWPRLSDGDECSVLFVEPKLPEESDSRNHPRLADMIEGVLPSWINGFDQIFVAEHLAEAISWLPSLSPYQSVVTPDGYWLGQGWVKVDRVLSQNEPGLLFRQQALTKLNEALIIEQDELSALQASRDKLHALRVDNDREQDVLQRFMGDSHEALKVCEMSVNMKHQALQQALMRRTHLMEEYNELILSIEELAIQKDQAEGKARLASTALKSHETQLERLITEKASWDDALVVARRVRDEIREQQHQAELQCNSARLKVQQLSENIRRVQRQMDGFHERLNALIRRGNGFTTPDSVLRASLNQNVQLHQQLELQLSAERQAMEDIQKRLSASELASKDEEQLAKLVQEKIQQAQLHEQGLAVRASGLLEALSELGADVDELLAGIPNEVDLHMREQALVVLDEKIKRLGAINLVAIEEYQTESERKQHLDEQYQDLTDALLTLDAAIAKMDKETQHRLKETFDQVNESFQLLFPRLFGGGRALLELTCDNLLEAGILVMAQPPGKRNSSIHLLSGGEKAMTAVALVFAIFQLNPSPFCMLDEVDAPLDDLNIRRFCDLVKEMSNLVQFLFITHNKVTMEMADHLIGVTMREPGVSRVVTVDVEAAVNMKTSQDSLLSRS